MTGHIYLTIFVRFAVVQDVIQDEFDGVGLIHFVERLLATQITVLCGNVSNESLQFFSNDLST